MNGKPQTAPEDEQEDLLEQIITQGLDKMSTPTQAGVNSEASTDESHADEISTLSEPEGSGKAAPPGEKKNRRSSVYLYLLVLFGAAFLLLLLAYFIQQRNSEDTISDLRNSMTLSREELLAEIKKLEEEKAALEEQNAELQGLNESQRAEISARIDSYDDLVAENYAVREELYSWKLFWDLEQCYQAGDYESCAAIMILQSMSQYSYRTPDAAQERQNEIIQAVLDTGVLDDRSQEHYDELLDAYLASHPIELLPSGC